MARKRKTRAAEPAQEPEPIQRIEPDPVAFKPVEQETEPEQPEPEETEQSLENENPSVDEEGDPGAGEEEETIEAEEEDQEPEETGRDMEEPENDNELETEITHKPPEISGVQENGGVGEKHENEDDDEEELEEEPLEKLLEPFTKDQLTLLIKESVSKHPDLVDNVNKLAEADPAHRKIFIHGLGWDATAETMTAVFGKYGDIEDCRVVKDKNSGKSKGYGFILFKHRRGARLALKEPQKLIEGRVTSCQLASAGPVQAPPATWTAAAPLPPVSEYTLRKIFVSNVSPELDTNNLVEYFSQFGEIEEGPLGLDKQTGKPRGFCLFVYKSEESAKKALEEPHKNFEGQTLHCQKAVDGPKHVKGGYFQQPPQQQQPHHHQGKQGYYHHLAKKGRYAGSSGGVGRTGGHLMAPSAGSAVPPVGFNPAVAPAAIGQAFAALLANQGAGMGVGNLIGAIRAGMNPQGVPPMMNNAGYGVQAGTGGYGVQPGFQGGYGGQPQMGQGGAVPHQGGAPYMGHGR